MGRLRDALFNLVPPRRRDWVRAALVEAAAVESPAEQASWVRSATWFLLKEALMRRVLLLAATAGAITVIVAIDRSPSDDAGQVTLGAILLASGILGAVAGRRAWVVGIVIGSVVAVTHLVSLALQIPEPGVQLPPGWASTTSLFVLVIPSLVAAYVGAGIRGVLAPGDAPPPA
jgi:hypothetical protein